ncbi:uncharacterized protein LOC131995591 [Stomoxys calcitrans]|uniref:uncharacterized protein LOC131995591 n=1 Tax=Stomoxys calcitrans TaxID=35570 RepID=UPI0027E2B29E|nr:uncharacterized protein LOC131995591 [Stomoxys calcitrans]
MLSRLPTVDEIEIDQVLDFETTEFDSDIYKELREVVKSNQEKLPDLKIIDNMIFKKAHASYEPEIQECQWIPETLTHVLIEQAHTNTTAAHGGISKTLHRLKEKYYWPQMVSQVRQYVTNCTVCKKTQ